MRKEHDRPDKDDPLGSGQGAGGASELLRRSAAYADADIEAARDRLRRQWDEASQQADAWRDAARGGASRLARAGQRYAHGHVWESVALAAVAGAVIAACVARRMRRR